jgi:hypothetical protein
MPMARIDRTRRDSDFADHVFEGLHVDDYRGPRAWVDVSVTPGFVASTVTAVQYTILDDPDDEST